MGKYKRYAQTSIVLALIITLALAIGPTIRTLAAETIFKIQNAELTSISDGAEGTIASFDESNIISNVVFHHLNDSATYKIILKNSDSKDHIIETITDDNEDSYISYNYNKHENELINAGNNLVFDLTATYSTANTDPSARVQSTNVKFYIHFTDVEEPVEIDLNVPNTGANTIAKTTSEKNQDTLKTTLGIIIAASAGLIIIAVIAVKKHKKFAKITAAFVIAGSAFAGAANVKAVVTEINSFTITAEYGLYDKLIIHNGDEDVIIDYGKKLEDVNEIVEPTKPGYTFEGWEDENGNDIDPNNPIVNDVTIRPKFTAITYTIKYNGNGAPADQQMPDQVLTYDQAQNLTTNTFTWDGHNFSGWDTTITGNGTYYTDGQEVKNLTTTNNDVITLYAQWSVNPYHIEYDANGGTGEMAVTNCEYEHDCVLRQNTFTKYGYDFKGWTFDGNNYDDEATVRNLATSDTITMVAKWEAHEYQITYTGLTDAEAAALHAAGNPDFYTIETQSFQLHNPADRKDNDGDTTQMFLGWREITTVTPVIILPMQDYLGNKTFEAVWQDKAFPRYDITYNLDGGEVATANPTTHDKTETFTLNNPTKAGYVFVGWTGTTIEGDTPVHDYTLPAPHVRSAIEFTAHYNRNTYTVNFSGNENTGGSTASMTMTYDEAQSLTANGFTKTGYIFNGWKYNNTDYSDGEEVINLTTEPNGVVEMIAQWQPTQYTIIFHANNENVENPDVMAEQVVTYDEEVALNANTYTWWQHKLVEWTTNANGTGTKYADKATIKNLNANGGEVHLYAKWREIDAALNVRTHNTSVSALRENINPIISANPDVKNFLHYPGGKPSDEIIATATDLSATIDPIWAWADGENLYWWSEDYKPRFTNTGSVEYSFYALGPLDNVDLTGFDTTSITGSCRSPFEAARIKNVDISDWDVSRCKDMGYFAYNSQLTSIKFPEVFDAQKVTNVAMAFNGAKIVNLDLSSWKTRDLKNASSFINMSSVEEVKFSSDFSTANVTTTASMFAGSSKLSSLDLSMFNTANVQNMSGMFNGVSNMATLDISGFDTGAVTNMSNMFSNMSKLKTLTVGSNFTAASVISMASIFANDTSLTSLDLSSWGATNSLTNLNRAFSAMTNLATLDLTGWDLSNVNNLDHTFHQTRNIETIYASSDTDLSKLTEDILKWTYEYATPKIVGGAGSTGSHGMNGAHSRIDDPDNGKPGYFTPKDSIYIRYHDNDGDDTNDEANYALMPSYYVSTAEPYDVKLRTNAFEKEHYKFMGWATSADGEVVYADGAALEGVAASKNPLELYAVWKEKSAMFNMGTFVNTQLKALNADAATFTHYTAGTPDLEAINNELDIAASTSNFPIWAWTDRDTIYWWSEAEKPSLNPDSLQMFNANNYVTISLADINTSTVTNLTNFMSSNKNLRNIDFGDGDFTNVTTMRSAFSAIGNNYTTEKLTIDLSSIKTSNKLTDTSRLFAESYYIGKIIFSDKFETSGVTDFAEMFRGCGSLSEIVGVEDFDTTSAIYLNGMFWNNKITSLDLTGWNTSNVTTIEHLFRGCSKLETLNVSNWNVANVTNMSDVFGTPVLNELDLSKWTNSKVTKTGYMFQGGNYTVLDLSGIDTSLVTDMGYMFNETGKIQTVYVSDKFVINTNQAMFINNKAMVGGAGTNYPGGAFMTSYGVVDDPDNSKPGFFTYKNARYIRYHDNDSDDTNDETNYALMPSHYMTTDSNNPYTLATSLSENMFERPGYRFLGWATSADGEKLYDDKAAISTSASKDPLELYAVWYKLEATLDTGANVNTILKNLATEPTAFEHYTAGTPNFDVIDGKQDIALATSDVPVYAWYDTESTKIYWWSEAEKPKMNTDSSSFFAGMSSVTSIDVEGLDASNATNMSHMFRGTGLTDIDFSKLESQNVTDMSYMFHGIKKTNTLDVSKLDTSSVKNMASMFEGTNFTSISFLDALNPSASKFKTNEVTSMHYMFKDSTKLTSLDLSSFNTSNVKDFSGTFYGATGLKTLNLDGWDTGNATSMYIMFNSASSLTRLDLSHFDTKNVTTMQQMFEGCFDLEYLNVSGWSNEKVGNMSYMFHKVGNYKNGVEIILANFKTPAVTTMAYMFSRDVTELEALDLSGFDTSNVTSMSSMFGGGSQGNGTFYNAKIKTVYASDKFVTAKVDPESNVFNNTTVIVGGAGTTWSQKTAPFARIDDPDNGKPGYFTMKNARYIRYHDNDGDDSNDETNYALMKSHYLKAGDSLKKNTFTRSGYVFTGWKDADNNEYTDEQVMADLVEFKTPLELYAQWEPTIATVTFNANHNDATGSMQPQIISDGNNITLALNTFERTYYNFLGWSTSADSSDVAYTDGADITGLSGNLELFAVWERMSEFDIAMFDAGKTRIEAADGKMYYQMQDMNSDICAAVPTAQDNNANEGRLVDNRDGKVYWVSKLKDEHCWMVQNLDHDIVTTPGYYTPDNTDITQDWTPTLATMNASSILSWDNTDVPHSLDPGDWYVTDTYVAIADDQEYDYIANGPNDYFKNTPFSGNGERGHVGNYYSWNAAMAMNSSNGSTMPAKTSICPKGWTVSHGNYAGLLNAYGVDTSNPAQSDQFLTGAPIYLTHAGAVTSTTTGSVDGRIWRGGVQGAYWAYLRDASGINYNVNPKGDILMTSPTGVTPSIWTARGSGWSVRCLAK